MMHCYSQEAISKARCRSNCKSHGRAVEAQMQHMHKPKSWWCIYLFTGWACNTLQPPKLVVPHGPEPHAGDKFPSQQRLIGGCLQRHVQCLKRLCYLDLAMYAAKLLLTI